MGDIIHHPEIGELIDALSPLASKAKVKAAYWIVMPDQSRSGNDWCHDCGKAKVRNLRKHDRKQAKGYSFDGGWMSGYDAPPVCDHCGVKLRGYLHFHGGIDELDHFRDNPPEPGNVDHAYAISKMLSAFKYVRSEHDALAKEAVEIARKLVEANVAGEDA